MQLILVIMYIYSLVSYDNSSYDNKRGFISKLSNTKMATSYKRMYNGGADLKFELWVSLQECHIEVLPVERQWQQFYGKF